MGDVFAKLDWARKLHDDIQRRFRRAPETSRPGSSAEDAVH
jgi:hypothetical protein